MSLRRKHISPDSPQALSSTGKRRRRLGGPRPQALSWVRQIVACDNSVLDRQIVAWAVARGRRAQGHRLKQKKAQVRHIADLILNLKMRSSNYVKFNKWRKYGITIRLHSLGHRRMDQGAARHSCEFLLDHDGYRHGNSYKGEPGRGYFPDHVSSNVRTWTMDREIFFGLSQRYGSWNEGLQMQRGLRSKIQVYSKVDQGRRKLAGRKTGEERGHFQTSQKSFIVPTSNPGEKSPGFFYAWIMDNRKKEQATSNMRQGSG